MERRVNWSKEHFIGFAMGLILPLIGSYLFYTFGWGSPTQRAFKTALSSNLLQGMDRILAYAYFVKFGVVTNIIPFLILNQLKKDRMMAGMIGATLIYGVVIIYLILSQ